MTDDFLYNDGKIRISYFNGSRREHSLVLVCRQTSDQQFILQRGVLEQLALSSCSQLIHSLNAINHSFYYALEQAGLDYEKVGLALAQARIRELQEELKFC